MSALESNPRFFAPGALDDDVLAAIEAEIEEIAANLRGIRDDNPLVRLRLGLIRASVEAVAELVGADAPRWGRRRP